MKLFFDTETTGKCITGSGPDDPLQPRIVQFAGLLTSDEGEEVAAFDLIVKPDGWDVPLDAAMIHGITTEKALASGVSILSVLSVFSGMCRQADTLIAHNIDFDYLVAESEYHRAGKMHRMGTLTRFCTMKAATNVCKIPGPRGYKWPKLTEAHRHLLGTELENAHDAMSDVRGCARIYFEMLKQGAL